MGMVDGDRKRGLSPVVGVALLIAIVLLLSMVMGGVFLGLSETSDDPPDAVLRLDERADGPGYVLNHNGGDQLGGEKIVLRGAADPDKLADRNLSAGESAVVIPTAEEITIVYEGDGESYELAGWNVDSSAAFIPDYECSAIEADVTSGSVTIDDDTIDCDITAEVDVSASDVDVDVQNGGVVVGDVGDEVQNVDVNSGGRVVGDVNASGNVDVDSARVDGDIYAGDDVNTETGSEVYGSIVVTKDTNMDLDGTTIDGDLVIRAGGGGNINDMSNTNVTGDVYVDEPNNDLTCSGGSTINGQNCPSYTPKDPSSY